MSSIARVLIQQGKQVTGSDLVASDTVLQLRQMGATVHIGHAAEHVNGAELVVTSTAITDGNPEVAVAQELGIPIAHRSEMWAHILNAGKGIAVAGAHGKTTITAMISWVLHQAGIDPTFLIGGEIANLGGGHSGRGSIVVAEADESDGSFLRYRPWCTVLTRVEPDHLEHYNGSFEQLIEAYGSYLSNLDPDGVAILCSDDEMVIRLGTSLDRRSVTYGLNGQADFCAQEIKHDGFLTTASVLHCGVRLGEITLRIPGKHNVQNALAVIAVCMEVGLTWDQIVPHLATYSGAKRRFEVVSGAQDILVVDDYAHHPSEVRATLSAARGGWPTRRVIAVFQPHRYSRTHFLLPEFKHAFVDADHVVLTDIYAPASEEPIPGTSGEILSETVREGCGPGVTVDFIPSRHDLCNHLQSIVRSGDIVVTMGAGDIWRTAREFAQMIGNPT